jgi:thiol-disulfide isomerase/thioredoxin
MKNKVWILAWLSLLILFLHCGNKNPEKKTNLGKILVKSNIPQAEIFLDNTSTGKVTPDTIFDVPAGSHEVKVEKSGYYPTPSSVAIQVKAGVLDSVVFVLNKLYYSAIKVASDTSEAMIVLDNQSTGMRTPAILGNVPVGKHIVSVYKDYCCTNLPGKEVVNLAQNDTAEASFSLTFTVPGVDLEKIPPNFNLPDIYNNWFALYNYRGFVIILNFWSYGSQDSRDLLSGLEDIYKDYPIDTLKIFAIDPLDELSEIQYAKNSLGLTFDLLRGKGSSVVYDYHLSTYPTTMIIDRTGKVYYRKEGYSGGIDFNSIRLKLNQLFY